ncbi:hypothetical protein M2277_004989 [Paenibacillus sp. LBL]|uniref:hypothetical protein n=1 Tax=Paenibacillus sp. LBL TaxID=2940563 RepID=UPI0024761B56|nr:hypothetical protein [Paenibacillus sp. LBL]MDH6674297.1 hypothetical protein [Paenibacillus sp. LBL]
MSILSSKSETDNIIDEITYRIEKLQKAQKQANDYEYAKFQAKIEVLEEMRAWISVNYY